MGAASGEVVLRQVERHVWVDAVVDQPVLGVVDELGAGDLRAGARGPDSVHAARAHRRPVEADGAAEARENGLGVAAVVIELPRAAEAEKHVLQGALAAGGEAERAPAPGAAAARAVAVGVAAAGVVGIVGETDRRARGAHGDQHPLDPQGRPRAGELDHRAGLDREGRAGRDAQPAVVDDVDVRRRPDGGAGDLTAYVDAGRGSIDRVQQGPGEEGADEQPTTIARRHDRSSCPWDDAALCAPRIPRGRVRSSRGASDMPGRGDRNSASRAAGGGASAGTTARCFHSPGRCDRRSNPCTRWAGHPGRRIPSGRPTMPARGCFPCHCDRRYCSVRWRSADRSRRATRPAWGREQDTPTRAVTRWVG